MDNRLLVSSYIRILDVKASDIFKLRFSGGKYCLVLYEYEVVALRIVLVRSLNPAIIHLARK